MKTFLSTVLLGIFTLSINQFIVHKTYKKVIHSTYNKPESKVEAETEEILPTPHKTRSTPHKTRLTPCWKYKVYVQLQDDKICQIYFCQDVAVVDEILTLTDAATYYPEYSEKVYIKCESYIIEKRRQR